MNRGSSCNATRYGRGGQSFNEAPIHESGKCGQSGAVASPHDGHPRELRSASMRPRFMNRGSFGRLRA